MKKESKCRVTRRSSFERSPRKLKPQDIARVEKALEKPSANPWLGKKLKGKLKGLLSYRIGKYRLIYQAKPCIIEPILIAHRETVYEP